MLDSAAVTVRAGRVDVVGDIVRVGVNVSACPSDRCVHAGSCNVHVKAAVGTSRQITATDAFDWFAAPGDDVDAQGAHRAMLSLGRTCFLPDLISANYDNPYPGASYYVLQIAAFWLSWARLRHVGAESAIGGRACQCEVQTKVVRLCALGARFCLGSARGRRAQRRPLEMDWTTEVRY